MPAQGVFAKGSGKVLLRWRQENPTHKFNVYYGVAITGLGPGHHITNTHTVDFSLCRDNISSGSGPYNELLIDGLTVGKVYFFYLRATSPDSIEGPKSKVQGVRVY
jgi:hypothetical protein